jgi:hypothetical protein
MSKYITGVIEDMLAESMRHLRLRLPWFITLAAAKPVAVDAAVMFADDTVIISPEVKIAI